MDEISLKTFNRVFGKIFMKIKINENRNMTSLPIIRYISMYGLPFPIHFKIVSSVETELFVVFKPKICICRKRKNTYDNPNNPKVDKHQNLNSFSQYCK